MRLIDADALREHFKEHERAARNYRAFESADAWGGAVHDVEDAPTIDLKQIAREYVEYSVNEAERTVDYRFVNVSDAEPVRHGYWIGLEYDGYAYGRPVYDLWECSECGMEHKGEDTPNYCPNCGAKMDLEVQDD